MSHFAVLLLEDGAKLVLEEEGAEKQRKCQSDLAKERFIGKSASFESKKILEIMYTCTWPLPRQKSPKFELGNGPKRGRDW